MNEYPIKAYAKINLGLDVTGKRPDGYHEVRMVMQSIDLHDGLLLERAESGITVITDCEELPTDENNLIYKAARLMLTEYEIPSGVRIRLRKNIPIAAGMAGGSTDAAATMKGICRLFGLKASLSELQKAAVSIGADVPYCLMGGTALAEGIGEKLTALAPLPQCHILIAKPEEGVSTKYVYTHLDAAGISRHPDIDGMVRAIRESSLSGVTDRMENVLETVTVPALPVIGLLKRRMSELGAEGSLMSGSGPTVFGIFREEQTAKAAYEQLFKEGTAKQLFLTRPVP